jgi:hypothetical protein
MRCFFLHHAQTVGVEILPLGLSDADAIANAVARLAKRKGPFTTFEVWDGARLVFRERLSAQAPEGPTALRIVPSLSTTSARPNPHGSPCWQSV